MIKRAWLVLMILSLSLFILGCTPVVRHNILSFFFDGVPPLAMSGGGSGALEAGASPASKTRKGKLVLFSHEPAKKCSNCHVQAETSGVPVLSQPVPQLCSTCHTRYAAARAYIHGPVAVGACLFCHDPHKSRFPHLLNKDEPALCYQCHEESMVVTIVKHNQESYRQCDNCHDPHIGADHRLLKPKGS